MKNDDETPLTQSELQAFAELPQEIDPPAGAERSTVTRLRSAGLIRGHRDWRPAVWVAAGLTAAAALFGLGLLLGVQRMSRWKAAEPRYVMFLYEGEGYYDGLEPQSSSSVSEFRNWARSLRARGVAISGAKFESGAQRLDFLYAFPEPDSSPRLAGYFVLAAHDMREAVRIARSCPHIRRGGEIIVRRVEGFNAAVDTL